MISNSLSGTDKIKILTDGFLVYLALALLALGSTIFFMNGGVNGFNDLKFSFMTTVQTDGYITDYERTNTIHDEEYVYKYYYSFPIGLDTYYGYSHSIELDPEIGDKVPIEYLKSEPDVSRIKGTTFNESFWVYIGLLILIAALIVFFVAYAKANKIIFVMKDATVTEARKKSIEDTGIKINEEPRYKVIYSFMAKDQEVLATHYTSDPDGMEESALLAYSNRDAWKYVWVEDLPESLADRLSQ